MRNLATQALAQNRSQAGRFTTADALMLALLLLTLLTISLPRFTPGHRHSNAGPQLRGAHQMAAAPQPNAP